MAKNTVIAFLAIGIFVLVGCGTSGPEKADSIEDIGGTWQRVRVGGGSAVENYCQSQVCDD